MQRPRRPGKLTAVALVALVIVVAGTGVLAYISRTGPAYRTPVACSLLTQAQVDAYVPGAVPGDDGDGYYCPWAATGGTGRLTVAVEVLPGERPRVGAAESRYGVRRRQAGTTVRKLSLGDESFMACVSQGCRSCTRVSNVVFTLELRGGARDPASSVRALTAQAVRHMRGLRG
ncbi:hypothetical protein [Actinomadura sp. DC4]|uniref:hypothetical protein n=1 Tax=Actinomadura sp. DC4 TaxID=3055069 RepID=UPI0025B1BA8E|nr:hypothetical protein [Actinomadura sp. DC4]MDN3352619.1 hypothetical protein [Actinomadura sp. DC4]